MYDVVFAVRTTVFWNTIRIRQIRPSTKKHAVGDLRYYGANARKSSWPKRTLSFFIYELIPTTPTIKKKTIAIHDTTVWKH